MGKLRSEEEVLREDVARKVELLRVLDMGNPEWALSVSDQSYELQDALTAQVTEPEDSEKIRTQALLSIARSLETIAMRMGK
jgi:hypothetical protein